MIAGLDGFIRPVGPAGFGQFPMTASSGLCGLHSTKSFPGYCGPVLSGISVFRPQPRLDLCWLLNSLEMRILLWDRPGGLSPLRIARGVEMSAADLSGKVARPSSGPPCVTEHKD